MKTALKSIFAAAALAVLLAGCSSSPPPPPQVFAPLTYNYLPPIMLTVANVTFQDNSAPDAAAAALNQQDPSPPASTVMAMAQHRLVATGTPGTATFTIETAAIEPVGDSYVGTISVKLNVVSADGRKTGYTEASVSVTQPAPDSDADPNQVQAVLYSITKQMMDQLNVQLQYHIQSDMGSWVSYNTNAATPALNSGSADAGGIQAAPLLAPGATAPVTGAAPTTTTTTTTTTVVPSPPSSGMPPMGVLGQLPVSP